MNRCSSRWGNLLSQKELAPRDFTPKRKWPTLYRESCFKGQYPSWKFSNCFVTSLSFTAKDAASTEWWAYRLVFTRTTVSTASQELIARCKRQTAVSARNIKGYHCSLTWNPPFWCHHFPIVGLDHRTWSITSPHAEKKIVFERMGLRRVTIGTFEIKFLEANKICRFGKISSKNGVTKLLENFC